MIRQLLDRSELQIILTGSFAEVEINEQLLEGLPKDRMINLSGKLNLEELMEGIRNARLMITNIMGLLHLADAQKTPVLGFFCPFPPHTPVQ